MTHKISFADFCADVLNEPISPAWIVAYKLLDGEPLTPGETEIAASLCGSDDFRQRERKELVAVKGRRAGGTKTACKYLLWKIHTCEAEFRRYAARRDRLIVPIVAQNRDTAREIMQYLHAFYDGSRVLGNQVRDRFANSIELRNGFVLAVSTCSYRAPRGIAAPLALLDETGVWRVEGADVDREVYRSLKPAMVQFPNRKLLMLGSPWVKRGLLFQAWQRRNERRDRIVIYAPTARMNPLIRAEELEAERAADPENFSREFEALWLDDVDSLLPGADIDAAIMSGVREVPAEPETKYVATIDASGLTGRDRFTFAIGHSTGRGAATDLLRGWDKQGPGLVCEEIAGLCRSYAVSEITCDQFGFSFLREIMTQRGIELRQLAFTTRSKPEVFIDLKISLSQGQLRLLDHGESLRELRSLESKRTSGGHVSISAPRGQHDDFACVLALLAHQLRSRSFAYGVLDFFKRLRTGEFKFPDATNEAQPVSQQQRPAQRTNPNAPEPTTDIGVSCCSNPLRQTIPGGFRCANCGRQTAEAALDFRSPVDGACPACKSRLIVPLGGRFHCNSCSADFGPLRIEPQFVSFANRRGPEGGRKLPWRSGEPKLPWRSR